MLRLSTKGEYGVRAMLELGLKDEGCITVHEIASRQGISAKYLEHLLSLLKKAGLVQSERGPKGGYRLSAPPSQITLRNILSALEGQNAPVDCLRGEVGRDMCYFEKSCALQEIWMDIYDRILDMLNSVTLEEICEKQKRVHQKTPMYYI